MLSFDETIDVFPHLVDFDKIFDGQPSNYGNARLERPAPPHFILTGASLENIEDITTLTLKFSELQRGTEHPPLKYERK